MRQSLQICIANSMEEGTEVQDTNNEQAETAIVPVAGALLSYQLVVPVLLNVEHSCFGRFFAHITLAVLIIQ